MKVQNIQTGEIFKVIINHSDGYEFGDSLIRHNKENYEVLPELEPDPLMGMTEEEYIDAYGGLPY
jgi:hypothetical protein